MDTSILKIVYINNYLKHVSANHYIHTSYKFQPRHVADHSVCTLLVLLLYTLAQLPLVVEPVLILDRPKDVPPYICVGCTIIFSVSSSYLKWRPSLSFSAIWLSQY